MNTNFVDKVFRMIFIFVFVMGTVWIPTTRAGASAQATGNGLHAEYRNLGGTEIIRVVDAEGPINHGWTGACPDTTIYQNQCGLWAGTWNSWALLEETLTGYIEAPATGTYIFQSWIDDYLEITINGITDLADDPGGAIYSMEINLVEGQFYPITMNFKNRWGSNDLSLWWTLPDGTNEIVPKQYLYTEIPNQQPTPRFSVWMPNSVHGYEWPLGIPVTLTIAHPDTPASPYYTDVQSPIVAPWGAQSTWTVFNLPDPLVIEIGDIVVMTNGSTMKNHVVQYATITNVNIDNDTVSGTADPNVDVEVTVQDAFGEFQNVPRYVTSDSNGNWSADFSTPGTGPNEQDIVDIAGGMYGFINRSDNDNDYTTYKWSALNPAFTVWLNQNKVDGYGWPENEQVTLTIGDPASPEIQRTEMVGNAPDIGSPGNIRFQFGNEFQLHSGQLVTLSDGTYTRTHTITNLIATGISAETNSVTGTADAGSDVNIENKWNSNIWRHEVAALDGSWTANFNIVGDEPDEVIADIKPGEEYHVCQYEQNVGTCWYMPLPNPSIGVRANNDSVEGWQWPLDATVTVTVDDPDTPTEPDITRTAVVYEASWNPGEYRFDLNLYDVIDIKPNFVVTATVGDVAKTLVVTSLAFTNIDLAADIVTGVAGPNTRVDIWTGCGDSGCTANRHVDADGAGNWVADFGHVGTQPDEQTAYNIGPGAWIDSSQGDEDGDRTMYGENTPNPNIQVRANEDRIELYQWPMGAVLTVGIDDPGTVLNPDYPIEVTVTDYFEKDPSQTVVNLDLAGVFDVQPGFVVTVHDDGGFANKLLTVSSLAFTDVDIATDTVTGIADPNKQVDIWVCGDSGCPANRHVKADDSGNWVADFGHVGTQPDEQTTYDIGPGTWIDSSQTDDDNDQTMFGKNVPSYSLHVNLKGNEVHGHDWPGASMVTLTIDNDADPSNGVLYTDTKQADEDTSCGEPCFNLQGIFTLQRGQTVTMSDEDVTKIVHISTLDVTSMDAVHDTISGVADPGSTISVDIHEIPEQVGRRVVADANGLWVADFSTLDNQNGQGIYDLVPGNHGRAVQLNPGKTDDGTLEYWSIPINNPPHADAGPDLTASAGIAITLDASASSDPDGDMMTFEWDLDNDGQYDDAVSVTTIVSFNKPGNYIVGLRVTDNDGLSDTDSVTITVLPWTLKGFYQPVDMNGIYNVVKNGSTVPFKFEIFAGSVELTDVAYIKSLTYAQTFCNVETITDEIETTTTGGTSLRYDATAGQFVYNWKTPKTAGKCYRVMVTTIDGSSLAAYFKLK